MHKGKGMSAYIKVTSIVDGFLGRSRVFHFRHGGKDRVSITSADLISRNLDRRIELRIFPNVSFSILRGRDLKKA